MEKNRKDSVFKRCVADIKAFENNGIIKASDVQNMVENHIESLDYNAKRLAAQVIAAVCLNQLNFRSIGGRSGIYLNPDLIKDFDTLGQLINNASGELNKKKVVLENLKQIGERNFDGQMYFDVNGKVHIEKSLEEIIEDLIAG